MEKQLPKNWVECTLGEIAEWGSGGTPSRGISEYYNGTIPWLKTGDLNDELITKVNEYITELGLKNSSAKLFPKDSVVIAMYGATIGKTGILGFDSTTNQACAVVIPYLNMNKFLFLLLKSEKENFIEKGKGGAQPNISQAVIKSHNFLLPPLAEQHRIVAKLDMLFAQLETIKTSMANIPLLLKDFRQQVLTQAVTGKLTEEWRKGKKLVVLKKMKLGDLGIWKGGGTPSKANKSFWTNGEIFWITPKDMKGLYLSNSIDKITKEAVSNSSAILIPENSILIVTRSGILRRILPISSNTIETTVNQDIKVLIPNEKAIFKFLLYSLRALEEDIRVTCMKSGTTVESVEFPLLKGYEIVVPSLQEQQEIVNRVESLFAKADAIEQQYKTLKASIDNLPQALLYKAFKGELSVQLGSDGHAKDLLEEIKALKDATGKVIKSKTSKIAAKKVKPYRETTKVLGMVAEEHYKK